MHSATIDFDTIEIQAGVTAEIPGCIEVSGTPNNWTADRIRVQADNLAYVEIEDAAFATWLTEKVEAQYAEQIHAALQVEADDCDYSPRKRRHFTDENLTAFDLGVGRFAA